MIKLTKKELEIERLENLNPETILAKFDLVELEQQRLFSSCGSSLYLCEDGSYFILGSSTRPGNDNWIAVVSCEGGAGNIDLSVYAEGWAHDDPENPGEFIETKTGEKMTAQEMVAESLRWEAELDFFYLEVIEEEIRDRIESLSLIKESLEN